MYIRTLSSLSEFILFFKPDISFMSGFHTFLIKTRPPFCTVSNVINVSESMHYNSTSYSTETISISLHFYTTFSATHSHNKL